MSQLRWAKGTEINQGDILAFMGLSVTAVNLGQLPEGARYADVTTTDGDIARCWDGFLYRVKVQLTTPAEL